MTRIESHDLVAEIDSERGVLTGLRDITADTLNYLGGPATFPAAAGAGLWTGDVVCRTWDAQRRDWRLICTADPSGARTVRTADGVTQVCHDGELALSQWFAPGPHGLCWDLVITNQSKQPVEVGELAVPLVANSDTASIFAGLPPASRAGGEPQRRWHETRVQQYLHLAGHGSYVLLQRPAGDRRIVALIPAGDTPLEAAYQVDPGQGNQWSNVFEGPYFLAVHSRAARAAYGWLANRERQNRWFHGNSSAVLEPGEQRRIGFEFALLDDVDELPGLLRTSRQISVEAAPGFTVPLGQDITVAVNCASEPVLVPESSGVTVQSGHSPFCLHSTTVGQKAVKVSYGENRWTRLLFYITPDPAALLRARASFIVREQLYDNPADPRHHAFLPYDDQTQHVWTDSEEDWQVGGSDEYGLPVAMFLAEKNVRMPESDQVNALETYIGDWLLVRLQDPATLGVRRGMFHGPDLPSRQPHEWTESESADERRFNNYPLVANIYHAMHRIAVRHGLTRRRSAAEYLTLAWKTAVHGFEVGELPMAGAPAGAGMFDLLADLETADAEGFAALDRYGPADLLEATLRVTRTLRWGFQPSWFRYGNEQRGSVCCWYGTAQNSEVLLRGFQRTGDPRLLRLGAAGLASFLTSVRENGAARGWFTWWPDRTGFDSRSLDTDLGLYAYLRSAAAYVITEPGFGLVGYGCAVRSQPDGDIAVAPSNGVDDRIYCDHGIGVRATGPIRRRARRRPQHTTAVAGRGDGGGRGSWSGA